MAIANPPVEEETVQIQAKSLKQPKKRKRDAVDDKDANAFRAEHKMEIVGSEEGGQAVAFKTPMPILDMEDAPFDPRLVTLLLDTGFDKPTPIQAQAWPICLAGRDMISVARTGSGKTLGFLLPTFQNILRMKKKASLSSGGFTPKKSVLKKQETGANPVWAVVLAPTRELAMQIEVVCAKFGTAVGLSSVCVYGGASKWQQINDIQRKQPSIVIATPGRLNDLTYAGKLPLDKVAILILDEADRMLDMGFEPQLEEIREQMTPQVTGSDRPLPSSGLCDHQSRQTLLFSATWPKSVRAIASKFLVDPVQLNVGDSTQLVANEKITQETIVMEPGDKRDNLKTVLEKIKSSEGASKTIVFFMTKRVCNDVCDTMWYEGLNCDALHGDKDQRERERIMRSFKGSEITTLFATDVAARGLDVSDITHVINYDFPKPKGATGIEDFVHRIGRTGRAGKSGTAITFFTKENKGHARDLVKLLKTANQDVPAKLEEMAILKVNRAGGRNRNGGWGGGGGGGGGGFQARPKPTWGGKTVKF